MPSFNTYEDLQVFLRNFINFHEDSGQYDQNGLVHLMLAILDNLRANALDVDLEEIGDAFEDDQAAFFIKIADLVRNRHPAGE